MGKENNQYAHAINKTSISKTVIYENAAREKARVFGKISISVFQSSVKFSAAGYITTRKL